MAARILVGTPCRKFRVNQLPLETSKELIHLSHQTWCSFLGGSRMPLPRDARTLTFRHLVGVFHIKPLYYFYIKKKERNNPSAGEQRATRGKAPQPSLENAKTLRWRRCCARAWPPWRWCWTAPPTCGTPGPASGRRIRSIHRSAGLGGFGLGLSQDMKKTLGY